MTDPGRLESTTQGPVDELTAEPRISSRTLIWAAVAALLVVALIGGWTLVRSLFPTLTSEQVRSLYDPPPGIGMRWEPPVPMVVPDLRGTALVAPLSSDTCRQAAVALFHYLPPGASDGFASRFEASAQGHWGVSSTARYPDGESAAAAFDALVRQIEDCREYVQPLRYGELVVTITGTPVTRSVLAGDRVRYRLTRVFGQSRQISALTGLRVGNTLTWQTSEEDSHPANVDPRADVVAAGVLDRIQVVARPSW